MQKRHKQIRSGGAKCCWWDALTKILMLKSLLLLVIAYLHCYIGLKENENKKETMSKKPAKPGLQPGMWCKCLPTEPT